MRSMVAYLLLALFWSRVAIAQTCGGFERWAVKVGSDPGVTSVDFANPVTTSLHNLVNLPRPTVPNDNTTRTNISS